jgi:hypothetical protein
MEGTREETARSDKKERNIKESGDNDKVKKKVREDDVVAVKMVIRH